MPSATASSGGRPKAFFPKTDAVVLSSKHEPPPVLPQTVWPIFDPDNLDKPVEPWNPDVEKNFYPLQEDEFAPSTAPEGPQPIEGQYLRGFLAENERLRTSMLWYYTRDILNEPEFLSGLQQKANLAQESSGWEYVIIGIQDLNYYFRLATVGLPLAIHPRGESLCGHTVSQPNDLFQLPNLLEDWRFKNCPYIKGAGLKAYAGAPVRLQIESGERVNIGSVVVCSPSAQEPLTKLQQQMLARLADWVAADIVQSARAKRQRERRRITELLSAAQSEADITGLEEPVLRILRTIYPNATITVQACKDAHVEIEDHDPVPLSELEDGLWEDTIYLDDFIRTSNQKPFPSDKVVRVIAAPCETLLGSSVLVVASKDFRLVFDDVDSWFVQSCATMLSQIWHKRLLTEAMKAKEKFLRGFSHQLRTPIHGILGSADLLTEELASQKHRESRAMEPLPEIKPAGEPEESVIYLDTIKSSGRDLISIVNNMITLNRWADIAMKDRKYALHTVYELETELCNEMRKAISDDTRYRASVFFNHDSQLDCVSFRTDLGLLRDSLLQLIINAIQNTSEGIITVTITLQPDHQQLVVDVEDTGRGIHPDDQKRIFEPYEKVGMHSTGAGLGLTLASNFATLLHGSVSLVWSEIGSGSHFTAIFREMDCVPLPPSEPLVQKLKVLPSKFHNMASGSNSVSLCNSFVRFLARNGFQASDILDDCFVIFDYVPGENHHSHLSQIPPGKVAICLVPASEGNLCLEQSPRNIFYATAPFLTSTMSSTLEDADDYLSEIKASHAYMSQLAMLTPPETHKYRSTDEEGRIPSFFDRQITNPPAINDGLLTPPSDHSGKISAKAGSVASVPSVISTSKPMALLVDDNNINLRILQMYCTKRGLPYCSATDGLQAVEAFAKQQALAAKGEGPRIQLIFMDLQMPVCDGFKATQQIRQLEKENKWGESILFIVTGQDSQTDRTTAEEVGADEFLVKPAPVKVLDRNVVRHFPSFKVG
ncbi:histidine kinase HHK3 [Trichoderma austrokoningii]